MQGSASRNEEDWLRTLLAACHSALEELRSKPAAENRALEEDLERFYAEVEERLRRQQESDAA